MSFLDITADDFSWISQNMRRNTMSNLISYINKKNITDVEITWPMIEGLLNVAKFMKNIPDVEPISAAITSQAFAREPVSAAITSQAFAREPVLFKPNPQSELPVESPMEDVPQLLCYCGNIRGKFPRCFECHKKDDKKENRSKNDTRYFQHNNTFNKPVASPQLKQMVSNGVNSFERKTHYPKERNNGYFNNDSRKHHNGVSSSFQSGDNYTTRNNERSHDFFHERNNERNNNMKKDTHERNSITSQRYTNSHIMNNTFPKENRKCACGSVILGDRYNSCYACYTSNAPVKVIKRSIILDLNSTNVIRFDDRRNNDKRNNDKRNNERNSHMNDEMKENPDLKDTCLIHFNDINDCQDCLTHASNEANKVNETEKTE
jgi:hypothetical protein